MSEHIETLGPFPINTIVVGDCLDVMRQMPDECVDLIVTDPPYNASYNSLTITGVKGSDYTTICEDWDLDFNPTIVWPELLRVARAGIVFCSHHLLAQWLALIQGSGFFRQIIHLQKTNPLPSARKVWRFTTLYGLWWAKSPYTFHKEWAGMDILRYSAGHTGIAWHPTPKPVAPIAALIRVHSNPGDIVFDPFMGSGTTAVAADRLGRRWFGCDINPEYVRLALKRIEEDRKKRAQLALL